MERAIAGESKVELEREMKRGAKKVIEFGTKEEGWQTERQTGNRESENGEGDTMTWSTIGCEDERNFKKKSDRRVEPTGVRWTNCRGMTKREEGKQKMTRKWGQWR